MISQSKATGLLQKIRNVTDVGEETFPRIFLAHNLRIQLSSCMFSSNNSNNKKSILLTAILSQNPSCLTNLIPLHDYDMMHDKRYQKTKQAQVTWVPLTIQVRGQYWTIVQRTGKLTTEDSCNIL